MRAGALVVMIAFAASACSVPDLGAASLVQGLRVLGAQAEPPEAEPGQSVTLTAWVFDTDGKAIDVSWSFCTLPADGLANHGCVDGTGQGLIGLGSGTTITMTVPDIDPALLGPPDATYGLYVPIVLHATAGNDKVDAIYRLRMRLPQLIAPGCQLDPPYSPHCQPNSNPSYASIDPLAGDDMTTVATKDQVWALIAQYATGAEEYAIPNSSTPTVLEIYTTQWFATAGTFPDTPVGGTAVQNWTIDRALPPEGGSIDLWVVAHDDRGGTGMTHRSFVLQ